MGVLRTDGQRRRLHRSGSDRAVDVEPRRDVDVGIGAIARERGAMDIARIASVALRRRRLLCKQRYRQRSDGKRRAGAKAPRHFRISRCSWPWRPPIARASASACRACRPVTGSGRSGWALDAARERYDAGHRQRRKALRSVDGEEAEPDFIGGYRRGPANHRAIRTRERARGRRRRGSVRVARTCVVM